MDDTQKISRELNRVYRHLLRTERETARLRQQVSELRSFADRQLKELNYADLLHDTIINCPWLRDKSFSLHGWAANYSFIYMLFRILDSVRPLHILEMGMGQTSRLTSQYVSYCRPEASVDIIENDSGWIKTYAPQLAVSDNVRVHQRDLEFFEYGGTQCRKYKDLTAVTGDTKYDLVIVDGPWGATQALPRSNVIDVIKSGGLADDFVIVFDDAGRQGEQNTVAQTCALLDKKDIGYFTFSSYGTKMQCIITSETRSFVQYL